ncbi:MAG: efflux RND transporter periplasmic adaptor subunit [Proteobacteria bacterium]|nr:efflux RND transporter periplasmic adaptor subunit [Pseudomonadota bacterium]
MKTKKTIIAVVVIVLVIAGYLFLTKKKPPPPAMHGVPVLAGKAVQKIMPVIIEAIGTVEALNSITVYSRIVGQLVKIHFKEGQDVRKGDLIFTIDPGPYQEKLKTAEAKLAQDTAQLKYNEAQAKRYAYLFEKGAASRTDYENNQTMAATQEAMVKADRADVDNARLNLEFCYIRAPYTGRTGAYGVNIGTMIKDNDTKLAVLNQITPIYVKFSVPEKQLLEIKRFMAKAPLKVKAIIPDMKENIPEGTLTFIDNTIDPATGMIMLKGVYQNTDKMLWPGQFVNVALELAQEPNAVVVPVQSVQISQSGQYVFIIKPDNKVEYRIVTVSRTIGDEAVISKGVNAGETVVTDGHLKLKDGFPVEIRDSLAQSAPAAPVKPVGPTNKK